MNERTKSMKPPVQVRLGTCLFLRLLHGVQEALVRPVRKYLEQSLFGPQPVRPGHEDAWVPSEPWKFPAGSSLLGSPNLSSGILAKLGEQGWGGGK